MSEKMRSRESQQSIDPVGVMKKVRESLQALIWSVQSNSAAYATIVLALVTGSGEARAQERPTWGRPDQVVAAMTVPASPWAPIARPTETAVVDVTSDGRKFASLSEKDASILPRADKRNYLKWQDAKIAGQNAMIAGQNARIAEQQQEKAQIAEARQAQQVLQTLVASYKANWSLNPSERQQAIQALRNPMIPAELRANLRKVFGINENV